MRPAQEPLASSRRPSPTPIFDALYAEYRRLFRALPFDRTGEEHLKFTAFGALGERGRHRGLTSTGYGQAGGPAAAWEPAERPRGSYLPAVLPPGRREGRGRGY